MRSCHACATESSCHVTAMDSRKSTTVAPRETATKCDSDACFRMKRRYTSFTRYDAPQLSWVATVDMYAAAKPAIMNPRHGVGRRSTNAWTYVPSLSWVGPMPLGYSTMVHNPVMIHGHGRRA